MTPASTRTRDRWAEARTGPGHLCPRNGKRPHTFQGTCDDTASWPPQRPADGQQRAALRREGDGTPRRVPRSDQPQSSHVLYGASEGFILLVPARFTEVHISSAVSSMCLRAKDHLEGTKVAVFPRNCAEEKVQTGSAAAGGHRRVATRKTTGDLTTRRGAGNPVRRAEWMTVSRYGHLRSAPTLVTQGVGTACTPCSAVALQAPVLAPSRWLAASPVTRTRVHCSWLSRTSRRVLSSCPELREWCRQR